MGHQGPVLAQVLLNNGANLNVVDFRNGRAPLSLTVAGGSFWYSGTTGVGGTDTVNGQLVQLLLDSGAEVDQPDSLGFTALRLALQNGLENLAEILLRHGADVAYLIAPALHVHIPLITHLAGKDTLTH